MPQAISNPPNPWSSTEIDWEGEPPPAELEVILEEAKSILSENDSPDLGFRWSINAYRGCYHGCAYCYARPSHQYLGYGAGTDFDRKIVVKTNAVELLRQAFDRKSWSGERIIFSGNTDCYQPLEAHYRLTRGMLDLCLAYRNPVGLITKGAVIRRDIDVLAKLAREASCRVTLSIAFADDETGRAIEPWASPISKRFETMKMLTDAGVQCGVSCAPLIPGINDSMFPEILQRAKEAGATHAFTTMLRLSAEVLPVFDERLERAFPMRHLKVMNAVREMRGGKLNDSSFHQRMGGKGERWNAAMQLFHLHARRLGLWQAEVSENTESDFGDPGPSPTFARPARAKRQLDLF